ncbi:hypothetical protein BBP40_012408 [Aspergillus hancockii]|nr:hypothetical protein BBP40_012408 [Aspergillus hancockii]
MPRFNTRDFDDWGIFFRLVTAMALIQRYVVFRGALYLDFMEDNRVTPAMVKILTWLSLFCGQRYIVTIITTRWDGLDEDGIEEKPARVERWKESELLQSFIQHGASIYHHGLVQENGKYRTLHIRKKAEDRSSLARNNIDERYRDPTTLQLQVYIEIANGTTVDRTEAGRWLKNHGEASSNPSSGGSSSHEEDQEQQQ